MTDPEVTETGKPMTVSTSGTNDTNKPIWRSTEYSLNFHELNNFLRRKVADVVGQ